MMADDVTDGLLEAWSADDVILRWSQKSEWFQTEFSYDFIFLAKTKRYDVNMKVVISMTWLHMNFDLVVWLYGVKDRH